MGVETGIHPIPKTKKQARATLNDGHEAMAGTRWTFRKVKKMTL